MSSDVFEKAFASEVPIGSAATQLRKLAESIEVHGRRSEESTDLAKALERVTAKKSGSVTRLTSGDDRETRQPERHPLEALMITPCDGRTRVWPTSPLERPPTRSM